MEKKYLRFQGGKTFLISDDITKIKKDRTPYFLIFDQDFLLSHFHVDTKMSEQGCRSLYVKPSKLGIRHITQKDGKFHVTLCSAEAFNKCDRQCIMEGLRKDHGDQKYVILSEEHADHKDTVEADISMPAVFQSFALDEIFPISYSPFAFHTIPFPENKSNRSMLSFGDENSFTISYLEGNEIHVSPLLERLETFYEMEEMDRLINIIVGHLNLKDLTLIRDYNNFSLVADYLKRFTSIDKVNHVFAHLANVMYDNGFSQKKGIGVIYDSSSFGPEGNILGGELIYGNIGNYEIVGRWKDVPLPGGDVANIEPWRISIALIKEAIGGDLSNMNIPLIGKIRASENTAYIFDAINKGNVTYTLSSSMHHIISAIGELLFYKEKTFDRDFFESFINELVPLDSVLDYYTLPITDEDGMFIINTYTLIQKLVGDLFAQENPEGLVGKLIDTIARATADAVERIAERYHEKNVFLGGEFFTNPACLTIIHDELKARGFQVYIPKTIPADNSSVSVGQLIYDFFQHMI
jgi:hydrogenase maturation factor HypF (carbamoyltransferase family)